MIAVSKSELKARMLHYFRKVEHSGEDLIVTKDKNIRGYYDRVIW